MTGIFRAYLAGTRGAVLAEFIFTVVLVIILAVSGTLFFGITISIAGFTVVCMMSANTCFAKYFAVMPIRPRTIVLAEYVYFLLYMAAGVAMAAVCAIIIGEGFAVSLNIIFFVSGYILTALGFVIPLYPAMKMTWMFLFFVPIVQMYPVLGVSKVHDIFWAAANGTPVAETDIFGSTTTPRWLVFIAVSLAVYAGSYFVSVKVRK